MGCGFFERVDKISRDILEVYSDIYFSFVFFCNNGYLKRIVNVVRLYSHCSGVIKQNFLVVGSVNR